MRRPISNSNLVTLPIVKDLKYNLKQKNALIQVVVGPRQIGKNYFCRHVSQSSEKGSIPICIC